MTAVNGIAQQVSAALKIALEGRVVTCVRPLQIGLEEVLPIFYREACSIGVVIDPIVARTRLGEVCRLVIHLLLAHGVRGPQRLLLLENSSVARFELFSRWLTSSRITLTVEPNPAEVRLSVLHSINAYRRAHSLSELRPSKELACAAEQHCVDLAQRDHLSHTGSDGSSPLNRAYIHACRFREVHETTVQGCSEAEAIVGYWAASSRHRAILLMPNLHEVGVSLLRPNALRALVLVAVYGGGAPRTGIRRFNSHCLRVLGLR